MRELIRPALFIIARTALFLSVVLWIVTQWWNANYYPSTVLSRCSMWQFGSTGIFVLNSLGYQEASVDFYREGEAYGVSIDKQREILAEASPAVCFSGLALGALGGVGGVAVFRIDYWLLVLLLILFNAFLIWWYRRGDAIE